MLLLEGILHRFGSTLALDGIDLDLARGETVALVGPSGCGKSTLLRVVAGLVKPDEGSVTLDGERLSNSRSASPEGGEGRLRGTDWRRRLGYVIQEGGLFPHLDVRGNLALQARHFGWPANRVAQRIEALLELVSLDPAILDRFPTQLSGGQRQRVALARALMLEPALLLLDEPLGALDPMIRADLQVELRDLFERLGTTVLAVTHDLDEARVLAHRLVLLRQGRIVQAGRFEALRDQPADDFVSRFVDAHQGTVPSREPLS